MRNKWFNFVLLLMYSALVFYVSAQSHIKEPIQFRNSDKLYHLLEYGVYGMLMLNFLKDMSIKKLVLWTIIISAVFAASDEFHQSFVPNRDPSVFDWIFDVIGIYIGTKIYIFGGKKWLKLRL